MLCSCRIKRKSTVHFLLLNYSNIFLKSFAMGNMINQIYKQLVNRIVRHNNFQFVLYPSYFGKSYFPCSTWLLPYNTAGKIDNFVCKIIVSQIWLSNKLSRPIYPACRWSGYADDDLADQYAAEIDKLLK